MPTTAALQASISGGANVTGGILAADGDTCQLSGVSTVGWAMQRFEIYSFPEGFALPAGWSLDAVTGAYYYAASASCPIFTMTPWGKYLFRLTVGVSALGLGLDRDGNADPALVDNTCAVSIWSPAGMRDLAWNETTQFDQGKKWVADWQANLRILDSGLGSGPVPNTRNLTAGAGLTGGGNLTADRTFNVGANGDGSIVVNANDVQVGVLATDAQHGARGGGTQHAVATGGAAGFMSAADKTRLDNMGDGATVAAITGTPPINITGGDSNPNIDIDPASGASAGSMSAAHFTLVNNASYSPTADVIPIRGSGGELLANYYTNFAGLSAAVASGLFRAAKNVVIIATRAASGSADHTLLSTDAADGMILGDLVTTATAKVKMKAAGLFSLLADTTKIVSASAAAFALFGDVDAAGGTGVFNLHDASVAPTTFPADGALFYSSHGAATIVGATGIKTGIAAQAEGLFTATLLHYHPRVGLVTTTTASPSLILAITIPSAGMVMEIELSVMGYRADTAFDARRILRARRVAGGVQNVEVLTMTGVADTNDFGAGTAVTVVAGPVNVNDLEISVQGPTTPVTVDWVAGARVTYFKK